ncbi:hypothetical protein A3C67_02940 [Candidatus Nomurabacteria bacterium RIFCSPHIGHO2_02_FULL_42_19]|uniref:Uncharacterized protein n=1 Tax=Candidatus Nomurabacteria bacterium RIFCSPHIGHO2_02_FULL_42_19 TaxID=1801756 RepID=A0A1F6W1B7_9BACT|nr:MAG: hypothetical protein A3C67_02940 [Candidatus Nomurabacteria bacterium RIFCSPHIGHO2_02_FULL_42_19]
MVNFFVANLAKQFGEIKNLLEPSTLIGKWDCLLIEVYYQDTKFPNFVFYVKPKTKEYLLFTTLIRIERIIIYQICLGFATIVIFWFTIIKKNP